MTKEVTVRRFVNAYVLPWERQGYRIFVALTTPKASKVETNIKLPKAGISKEEVVEMIEKMKNHNMVDCAKPKISGLFSVGQNLVLIEGTYLDECPQVYGYEHHFFGMLSLADGKMSIEHDTALLRVISVDGNYYFVSYFKNSGSGAKGMSIDRLEGSALICAVSKPERWVRPGGYVDLTSKN